MFTIARTLDGNRARLRLDEPSRALAPLVVAVPREKARDSWARGRTINMSKQEVLTSRAP
jgi:ABC-type branched-subunit amino acid transport system ATPase component